MLASVSELKNAILSLSPTTSKSEGISNLVNVISNYMNQVQGGSSGAPGIFSLNNSQMISGLSSLSPVSDNSWINTFVSAFQQACETATITPGTVSNPVWLGSGSLDVSTLPSGASTITTISAAVSTLSGALSSAKPDANAPTPLAQGIHDATLDFIFTCIGLGAPPTFTPIPVPTSAE